MSFDQARKRINEAVLHVIFPVFSELDAIALLYSLTIASIEHRWSIVAGIREAIQSEEINTILVMLLIGGLILYAAIEILKMARHTRTVSKSTKVYVASFFYISIAVLTFFSGVISFGIIKANPSRFSSILLLIQGGSLVRALSALILLKTNEYHSFLGERFNNTQATKHDLLLIALALPTLYWLNYGYDPATIILVSYFYTVVIVSLLHDLERAAK